MIEQKQYDRLPSAVKRELESLQRQRDVADRHLCAAAIRFRAAGAFGTTAVMIREPEKKKEQEKRRPGSRLSPWS
jgi:rRNA-processing protein FCF1